MTARTRKPAAAKSAAATSASKDPCNVPGCPRNPEWRGLCPAHRQTHRGLADPKPAPQEEATPGD